PARPGLPTAGRPVLPTRDQPLRFAVGRFCGGSGSKQKTARTTLRRSPVPGPRREGAARPARHSKEAVMPMYVCAVCKKKDRARGGPPICCKKLMEADKQQPFSQALMTPKKAITKPRRPPAQGRPKFQARKKLKHAPRRNL